MTRRPTAPRDTGSAPRPLFCAQTLARIAAEHKWVIAAYLITFFIVLPVLVIIRVGVF